MRQAGRPNCPDERRVGLNHIFDQTAAFDRKERPKRGYDPRSDARIEAERLPIAMAISPGFSFLELPSFAGQRRVFHRSDKRKTCGIVPRTRRRSAFRRHRDIRRLAPCTTWLWETIRPARMTPDLIRRVRGRFGGIEPHDAGSTCSTTFVTAFE